MKKIKIFLGVVLFGAISFGAFSAYDYYTMSAEEKALLENVEALTYGEGGTKNTGPGKTYDCPGWGTGDGKMCMSTNGEPCTELPC